MADAKSAEIHAFFNQKADAPTDDSSLRLSFKRMATTAAQRMAGDFGVKALAPSGTTIVGQEFDGDPIAMGRVALSIFDVMPVKRHLSPEFAYLRQATRNNAAAPVADHGVKPTSTYGLERISAKLETVAHISEAIPRAWVLQDNEHLASFIQSEMTWGLQSAVANMVYTKLTTTSGIQAVPYSTSPIVSLRSAITAIENQGYRPTAFLVNPVDFQGIEIAATATAGALEHSGLPYDAATRRLYSVPVVTDPIVTAGSAVAISDGSCAIDVDTDGVQVQWSENATPDSWVRNEILCRVEGRFQVSCYSPLGIAKVALK